MPYANGDPTLSEQIATHMEMKREADEARKIWDEAFSLGVAEMRSLCAQIADDHAKFCREEAEAGGHPSLFERSRGAAHLAKRIREAESPKS